MIIYLFFLFFKFFSNHEHLFLNSKISCSTCIVYNIVCLLLGGLHWENCFFTLTRVGGSCKGYEYMSCGWGCAWTFCPNTRVPKSIILYRQVGWWERWVFLIQLCQCVIVMGHDDKVWWVCTSLAERKWYFHAHLPGTTPICVHAPFIFHSLIS